MNNFKLYEHISEKSILVITPDNELKTVCCPFLVLDKKNRLYQVTSIALGNDGNTYYMINTSYCIYSGFTIINDYSVL